MDPYILILLAVILLAGDFVLQKLYQKTMGADVPQVLLFNTFLGIFTAVAFFFINGCQIHFSAYSFVMASIMPALSIATTLLGFRLMRSDSMALYTLALMAGGMTVPYVFGLLFLHEEFRWLRLAGLVLILAAVISSNVSKKRTDNRFILFCVAVFFLNGFVSVVSKLHQTNTVYPTVTAVEFVMYTGAVKALLSAIVLAFSGVKKEKAKPRFSLSAVGITAASAVVSGGSYMFQLLGAVNLPASVLYPFVTGGTIILTSLAGILFFKERLSLKIILCIAVCFVGTCLFL